MKSFLPFPGFLSTLITLTIFLPYLASGAIIRVRRARSTFSSQRNFDVDGASSFSLDKFLEVMGPGLFPVQLILSLIPFAVPAVPFASWAEAYYEEQHKQYMQHQNNLSRTDSHGNGSTHSGEHFFRMKDGKTKWFSQCKTISISKLKVMYEDQGRICKMVHASSENTTAESGKEDIIESLELVSNDSGDRALVK